MYARSSVYFVYNPLSVDMRFQRVPTIRVPLVFSPQQEQEVLHLHHAVMGTVVRHDYNDKDKQKKQ